MGIIGKYAPDGSIEYDVTECALTGRKVLGWHSVKQGIEGTPYFYRYLSSFSNQLTDEKRAEVAALIPQETIVPPPPRGKRHVQSETLSTEESNEVENE